MPTGLLTAAGAALHLLRASKANTVSDLVATKQVPVDYAAAFTPHWTELAPLRRDGAAIDVNVAVCDTCGGFIYVGRKLGSDGRWSAVSVPSSCVTTVRCPGTYVKAKPCPIGAPGQTTEGDLEVLELDFDEVAASQAS